MTVVSEVNALFAGKPIPFGPKASPSSIVKQQQPELHITKEGATADEQGNKKLHGGIYMALHQYAQSSYTLLQKAFPNTPNKIEIGTIGENISAANMHESNVYIGDQYRIGSTILQVVSPRAPCSRINQRYGQRKIDLFIADNNITGWYFSVLQTGKISVHDTIHLEYREQLPLSVAQIWQLRKLKHPEDLKNSSAQLIEQKKQLANNACKLQALSPEWQAYMKRVTAKLNKY